MSSTGGVKRSDWGDGRPLSPAWSGGPLSPDCNYKGFMDEETSRT